MAPGPSALPTTAYGWSWGAAVLLARAFAAAAAPDEVERVACAALPSCVGGNADVGALDGCLLVPLPLLELAVLRARILWQYEDLTGAVMRIDELISAKNSAGDTAGDDAETTSIATLKTLRAHISALAALQASATSLLAADNPMDAHKTIEAALCVARVSAGHALANPRLVASLLCGQAAALLAAGRPEPEALCALSAALEACPGHVVALLARARLHVRVGAGSIAVADYDAAIAALRRGQQTGTGGSVKKSAVIGELRDLQAAISTAALRRAEADAAEAAAAGALRRECAARERFEEDARQAPERELQAAERRRAAAAAAEAAASRRALEAAAREARRRANEEARAAAEKAAAEKAQEERARYEEARRRARAEWEAQESRAREAGVLESCSELRGHMHDILLGFTAPLLRCS